MAQPYIHGFSTAEQRRLIDQAQVLAPRVFEGIELADASHLLEIGCGVGAELAILAEGWPHLRLTGVDRSGSQISAARRLLTGSPKTANINLVQADALHLPFPDAGFDRVITIWMLEHVAEVRPVMDEALRVTQPEGKIICTEVDNATLRFDPPDPVIEDWWQCFNRYQQATGGDPFVGSKLDATARALGCKEIETQGVAVIDSLRDAERRTLLVDYLRDLLLSGAGNLIAQGYATETHRRALQAAFARVRANPAIAFRYHAVRLTCSPPACCG